MKPSTEMRRFVLVREEDVSGVSGVGIVAEGIEFSEGTVAMKWLTPYATIEIAQNIKDVEHVHGHDGRTVVVWIDEHTS